MFSLTEEAIAPDALKDALRDHGSGALATFEGWVRDQNEGKAVHQLAYEAYGAMAAREGERILQEACERFGLKHADCVHRVGTLALGDVAVWVGVSAPHRGEAFQACRYIIDEVKHRVPIWKKEFYDDGDSGWVNCERCAAHAHEHVHVSEDEFYDRQVRLASVGTAGQERLRRSKVLIIGAGGLGCPAATYLAAAGVGTIGLCDGDLVEASNLHRQPLFTPADIGQPKALIAAGRLRAQNPFIEAQVYTDKLSPQNAEERIGAYDLVLDCTDNFNAKFLINDAALVTKTPAIVASIYQYEGQLQVIDPRKGGPCLRCVWPEMPEPGCVGSCAEVGVIGAVPGVLGSLQAMEAIKFIIGLAGITDDATVFYDLLSHRATRVKASANGGPCTCISRVELNAAESEIDIDPSEALHLHYSGALLIDIREPAELADLPSDHVVDRHLPMSEFEDWMYELSPSETFVLVCARGARSSMLSAKMREQGFRNVYSLHGGLPALLAHTHAGE